MGMRGQAGPRQLLQREKSWNTGRGGSMLGTPGIPGGDGSLLGTPGIPGGDGSMLGTLGIPGRNGSMPGINTGNTGRERIRAMNTLGIHRETIPNPGAFSHFPNPGSCPHCGISTLGIVGFMESWKKLEKLQAQFHGKVGILAPGC